MGPHSGGGCEYIRFVFKFGERHTRKWRLDRRGSFGVGPGGLGVQVGPTEATPTWDEQLNSALKIEE